MAAFSSEDFIINSHEIESLNDYTAPTTVRLAAIHDKLSRYGVSVPIRQHTIPCGEFKTVYIISDIHADLRKFIQTMQLNGFIHIDLDPFAADDVYNAQAIANVKWMGGENVLLLVLGDLVDGSRRSDGNEVDDPKGIFEILLHVLLHNMRLTAKESGSEVIFTLGNHDLCAIFGSGYKPPEYQSYVVSYTHKSAKLYYQDLDPIAPQNQQNSINAIKIADTRKAILQPFYKNCLYLFIRFMNSGNENVIMCVHGGIHRHRTSHKENLAPFITLQQDIDANGPTLANLSRLRDSDLTDTNNIFFTRSIDARNRAVCDSMNTDDPLVIVGHCPTHQLDDSFRDALGLEPGSNAHNIVSNRVYDGCDYYPSNGPKYFDAVAKNNIRGCVIMGCAHDHDPTNINLIKNIDNPKYILVDTASSVSFRYPDATSKSFFPSIEEPNIINRVRRVELLKLSRNIPADVPGPRYYYNIMQRQIEGIPYDFTLPIASQPSGVSASMSAPPSAGGGSSPIAALPPMPSAGGGSSPSAAFPPTPPVPGTNANIYTNANTVSGAMAEEDLYSGGSSLQKKTNKKRSYRKNKKTNKRKNKKRASRKRRNI